MEYPPPRTTRFSAAALTTGVETLGRWRESSVTSAAKTVADCFKLRNKVWLDVALGALYEDQCVTNVMSPYLEAVEDREFSCIDSCAIVDLDQEARR